MSRVDSRSNVDAEPVEDGDTVSQGDYWLFGTLAFVILTVVVVTIVGLIMN